MTLFIATLLLVFCIGGCGPKEIGEGTSAETNITPEATGADVLRLPMTGMSNTQRMLYWQNRPDVMIMMQRKQADWYSRRFGHSVSPESPDYRAVPKQRSPFRQ